MILPRRHDGYGSAPPTHLAGLFFTAYNPLPSAKSGSIGSSAVEETMAAPDVVWKGGRFGRTSRRDPWWLSPTAVFLGFSAFIVYSTWAAWQGNHYTFG